jgi:hypothetical protein
VLGAVARQESNFNPLAVGRSGEIGMFQILPSTATRPGFGVTPANPTGLFDPLANILFGANYLAARAGQGVNWSNPADRAIALARYNGGGDPNYVQRVEAILAQAESPIDRINRNRPNIGAIPGAVGDAARRAQEAIQGAANGLGGAIDRALGRGAFLILGLIAFAVGLIALARSARD